MSGLQQVLFMPSFKAMRLAISIARKRLADLKWAVSIKGPDSVMEDNPLAIPVRLQVPRSCSLE
jgi:hypothetical protein